MTLLPYGKLDHRLLADLLRNAAGHARRDVLVGPRVGEDAAAVRVGDGVLVTATDPVTFATDRIGWYAVHINANDVAAMGAQPRWFQACVLLPPCPRRLVRSVFAQIDDACRALGVSVIGGHTEITVDLSRPIVVGTMMGLVQPDGLVRSAGARPGDDLVVTKGIAVEGTALIAREKRDVLQGRVPRALWRRARRLLDDPGISVVREALLASRHGAHALHDPTEGGLVTGVWEMAEAAGIGVELDLDAVPVLPESRTLCEVMGLDVYRTLASGALLAAVPPAGTRRLVRACRRAGIAAESVGRFVPQKRRVHRAGRTGTLRPSAQDEITKVFE